MYESLIESFILRVQRYIPQVKRMQLPIFEYKPSYCIAPLDKSEWFVIYPTIPELYTQVGIVDSS